MQAFGIEVRKSGSLHNLYRDVDRVLNSLGISNGGVSVIAQQQAVAHSLQKMLKADSHFSVCTIDKCVDVCQIPIPSERYRIYRAAHCIDWNEMTAEYRQMLQAMVLDDFRSVLTANIP